MNIEWWVRRVGDRERCDRIGGMMGCVVERCDGSIVYGCKKVRV